MHAKWIWICHENPYKDHESTISVLRMQVHTSVAYVGDSYLQENCKDCRTQKIVTTVKIVGLKRHRQNYDAEIELSIEACK